MSRIIEKFNPVTRDTLNLFLEFFAQAAVVLEARLRLFFALLISAGVAPRTCLTVRYLFHFDPGFVL